MPWPFQVNHKIRLEIRKIVSFLFQLSLAAHSVPSSKSNLTRHSISHTDLKQYVCETCGKTFKDRGALKQHTFSHGTADYPCDICGQRFTSPCI